MRILHIEKAMPAAGGIGSYLRILEALQRRAGHEVFRFGCVGEGGPEDMPTFRDFAARRDPRDIVRMIHDADAASALARFLRGGPIDVAHLHNIYHHLTPSILPVLARGRIGIVMTVHDYRLACPTKHFMRASGLCTRCVPNKFYHAASPRCAALAGLPLALESLVQRLLRRYYRWVDVFLCPTQFMRDLLVLAGAPARKVVVVRNPVEPIPLPDDVIQRDNELLYFGRLNPEKAPQLMLDLAERLPEAQIVIAGDGPLYGELDSAVAARRLSNVALTGHLDRRDAGRYLARAAAVVLTSKCMENSPGAMLEGMAAGRCVIVPDQPPLREWVRDAQTGRTFAPGDARSLVAVAGEVLADAAGRESMARAGAELVAARHGAEAVAARIEECYRESIARCALR
ncbi:MAG TPA: glycosyltransferase family 4 protein [Phycisphaerae bacterium]|nr:glycosyltransferase family 4 protein [Phycisphaerae bacterium]